MNEPQCPAYKESNERAFDRIGRIFDVSPVCSSQTLSEFRRFSESSIRSSAF